MARASVKLIKGSSFDGGGHKFKKAETKIVSSAADIAYFEGNPRFRVKRMDPPPKPAPKPASAPPTPSTSETSEGGNGPLPWNKTMKKAELQEAATSRDIAFTPEDTIANLVQLLTEWDEDGA
jgi:hypothetical protein